MADQIRGELATLLARDVHDPGIGFVTLTRVQVSPDLQVARVLYTVLGDDKARVSSAKALDRAAPFLRRQIGARLRLKRVPDLRFQYDEATAGADRIEQILNELHAADVRLTTSAKAPASLAEAERRRKPDATDDSTDDPDGGD